MRADRFAIAAPNTPSLTKTVSSLTRSGTTATCVTTAAHGCLVNDYIAISEASDGRWNQTFKVLTVPNTTTLTFTVDGTAPTPATPLVAGQPITLSKVCLPFIVTTTTKTYTVDGQVVETVYPGVYITDAAIQNATISGAQIKNATIDSAKIFSLTADKITSGDIQVGNCISSAEDASVNGLPKWQICGNGNAHFQGVTIYGADGSVLLSSGGGVAGASANLIPNSAFAGMSGTNPPPWVIGSGTGGAIFVNPTWAPAPPAGVNTLLFYRDGYETTTFIFGHSQQRLSVLPSTKYEYSAYIASYNQNIDLVVGWYNASGILVSSAAVATHTAPATVPDLTNLANWARVGSYTITSPADAVSVNIGFQVNPRIRSTSFPHTYIARPYFGRAREGQTALSPWSTGGENALYDVYAKSMAVGGYLKSTSFNGTPDNLLLTNSPAGNPGTAGWCINGKGEAVFDGLHLRNGTVPTDKLTPGFAGAVGRQRTTTLTVNVAKTLYAIAFNFEKPTIVQFFTELYYGGPGYEADNVSLWLNGPRDVFGFFTNNYLFADTRALSSRPGVGMCLVPAGSQVVNVRAAYQKHGAITGEVTIEGFAVSWFAGFNTTDVQVV